MIGDPPRVVLMGHSSTREHFTYGYGLARVRAYVEKRGIRVETFHHDRRADDEEEEDFKLIRSHNPDIVGLATYLWNTPRVARLVTRLRSELPKAIIVLGGPSVLGYQTVAPDASTPDYMIVGEGEVPFANLLEAYLAGKLPEREASIGSLVSFRTGRAVRNPDDLPFQALEELGSPYLMGHSTPQGNTLYLETSRGCPYKCSFCVLSTKVNKMRYVPIDMLEQELRWALERGHHDINICDSALNYHTDRLEALVELFNRVDPMNLLMYTFALHSDYINDQQIELLSRLRIKQTTLGLNSITPETFKDVKRKIIPERFAAAVKRLAQVTRPVVSVVMGLPGETVEGFARTLEFCEMLDADIEIFELKVIPETTYFDRAHELGLRFDVDRQMNVIRSRSFDEKALDQMRTLAITFQSQRGRWRQEYFVGPEAHLSGGLVGQLRRALISIGLLEAETPYAFEGWHFVNLDAQRRQQALLLDFKHDSGEDFSIELTPRTDERRSYAKTMLFNLSYSQPQKSNPSAQALSFLARFHRDLCAAENATFPGR